MGRKTRQTSTRKRLTFSFTPILLELDGLLVTRDRIISGKNIKGTNTLKDIVYKLESVLENTVIELNLTLEARSELKELLFDIKEKTAFFNDLAVFEGHQKKSRKVILTSMIKSASSLLENMEINDNYYNVLLPAETKRCKDAGAASNRLMECSNQLGWLISLLHNAVSDPDFTARGRRKTNTHFYEKLCLCIASFWKRHIGEDFDPIFELNEKHQSVPVNQAGFFIYMLMCVSVYEKRTVWFDPLLVSLNNVKTKLKTGKYDSYWTPLSKLDLKIFQDKGF